MNRSIALFVALVLLLAHILAIHNDGEGYFAYPYDQAFVALRMAKNWVLEGQLRWNPGTPAFESYPSLAWLGVAAVGERLALTMTTLKVHLFLQTVGVFSVLLTVIMAAHFRADRAAGLIAPLLLVTSGSIAAAASSGLETGLFMLTVVASFWSLERGYSRRFALALTACVVTRPEGVVVVLGLLTLRLWTRVRDPNARGGDRALWPFTVPALAAIAIALVRRATTGQTFSPTMRSLLRPYADQWVGGLDSLLDFLAVTVSLLLLAYPLIYLVRGRLSRLGARALFIALLWTALCVWQGRSPLPFGENMAPALPLIFLAVQEGMIEALDGTWQAARRMALCALAVCMAGSALASKIPGRLGPLATERWHEAWMEPRGSARFGYRAPLGRLGVIEEIADTNRMRALGAFMGEQLDASRSVLTPWPGSVGYHSRLRVLDVLGRANPIEGVYLPTTWSRREAVDLVAALETHPDYVVPMIDPGAHVPTLSEVATEWRLELDAEAAAPGRQAQVERSLAQFELITVPLEYEKRGTTPRHSEPFLLLRRRDLELRPKLAIFTDGRSIRVEVRHSSHPQIVDLQVTALDESGRTWSLRPTGELVHDATVQTRVSILLYDTGTRAIELIRTQIPDEVDGARITSIKAVLLNPNSFQDHLFDHPFARVSDEAAFGF